MSTSVVAQPQRWWDSDFVYDFRHSPIAIVAAIVTIALIAVALGANFVAPFNVNDPASANIVDARLPPGSLGMFGSYYLLGTDPQGRDILSAVIFGLRTSLLVGGLSVLLAALIGILLGLVNLAQGGQHAVLQLERIGLERVELRQNRGIFLVALGLVQGIAKLGDVGFVGLTFEF